MGGHKTVKLVSQFDDKTVTISRNSTVNRVLIQARRKVLKVEEAILLHIKTIEVILLYIPLFILREVR